MSRRRWWIGAGALALLMLAIGGLVAVRGLEARMWDALVPRTSPTPSLPQGIVSLSASTCAACHAEVFAEWQASRMGTAMRAPAFLAEWQVAERMPYCLNCHAPLQAQQQDIVTGVDAVIPKLRMAATPNPAFDAALQAEGVTCVVCHVVEGDVVTASAPRPAPHALRVDGRLRTSEGCALCHEGPKPELHDIRRPMIDTVAEHAAWQKAAGRTESCIDCHMARVERRGVDGVIRPGRRHDFPGGWDEAMLSRALALDQPRRDTAGWSVEVTNQSGHRLPTGERSAALEVRFVARDAAGKPIGTDAALLVRVIDGPPFRERSDTTLDVGEKRRVVARLDAAVAAAARTVDVEVVYRRATNAPHAHEALVKAGAKIEVPLAKATATAP